MVPIDTERVETAQVRGLVLDHLMHGMNVAERPEVLFSPYLAQIHRAARFLHERPARAFFVGGGAYTLPRLWAKGLDVTVAEIDPAVTAIARDQLWVDPSAMTILHEDARRALRDAPVGHYDLIIGDAFKDIAAPFHLVTQEFNQLVASRLGSDGIYLLNLVDRAPTLEAVRAVFATLRTVFPTVAVWREGQQDGGRVTFVLAASTQVWPDARVAQAAFDGWARVDTSAWTPAEALVLTDDFAPLERLLKLATDHVQ